MDFFAWCILLFAEMGEIMLRWICQNGATAMRFATDEDVAGASVVASVVTVTR